MKSEINKLGENIKDLLHFNEKDWNEIKKNLESAKDRNNNKIDMSCVGVSSGLFVPCGKPTIEDWLTKGDKIALEHAKEVNKPKKNGISIYYERLNDNNGGLIDDEQVKDCLGKGIYAAIK